MKTHCLASGCLLLVLGSSGLAGPSLQSRLAALRSKHGLPTAATPLQDDTSEDAEDRVPHAAPDYELVAIRDLRRGDWVEVESAGKVGIVKSTYEGTASVSYGADHSSFGRTAELKGGSVRRYFPTAPKALAAKRGIDERQAILEGNQRFNAMKAQDAAAAKAVKDAELAAFVNEHGMTPYEYSKKQEAEREAAAEALARSRRSAPAYQYAPIAPRPYTPAAAPSSSGPAIGSQAWHDHRALVTHPQSYYQNKY